MIPFRHSGALNRRLRDAERINAMTSKITRVVGRVLVELPGEAAVDIAFPVLFNDLPIFGFGGELAENHRARLLQYPTVSAVVTDWVKQPGDRYSGARIAVVTTGLSTQQMWIHYSFEAPAIRNPIGGIQTADDVI